MIKSFIRFARGLLRMPLYVHVWLILLSGVNVAGAILWPGAQEGLVTIAVFTVNILLMGAITSRAGFSRLLGLGHFLWIPLAAYLVVRLQVLPAGSYANWIRILLIMNGISLAIDATVVVRWSLGDRREIVEGL